MKKSSRIGMRISPEKKDQWEETSKAWGYGGLSSFIEAMCDWAIAFEKYDGNYEAYLKAEGGKV